jgi:hypothetical protein
VVSIEVFKDLNVGLPKEDNAFWNIINTRSAFVIDPNALIQSTGLQIVTFDRNVIFRRKVGIEQLITEDIDGDIIVSAPWRSADIDNGVYRDESNVVLGRGNVIMAFSYQGDATNPICSFPITYMQSVLNKQFPGRKIIMETNSFSIEDVREMRIRDTPDSPLKPFRGSRKIVAFDTQQNATGFYQFFHILFNYDAATYDKYIQPEYIKYAPDGSMISIHSPSGFSNEGSKYYKEQFIAETVELFSRRFEKSFPGQVRITGYEV